MTTSGHSWLDLLSVRQCRNQDSPVPVLLKQGSGIMVEKHPYADLSSWVPERRYAAQQNPPGPHNPITHSWIEGQRWHSFLSKWIKYMCKISSTNRIEMNTYARQGVFLSRACSGSSCLLTRHYTGTHQGQILLAKSFKGGTAHMCWLKLSKCLRDMILLEMEVLTIMSEIYLVVGKTLIAQHDCGCQNTLILWSDGCVMVLRLFFLLPNLVLATGHKNWENSQFPFSM